MAGVQAGAWRVRVSAEGRLLSFKKKTCLYYKSKTTLYNTGFVETQYRAEATSGGKQDSFTSFK